MPGTCQVPGTSTRSLNAKGAIPINPVIDAIKGRRSVRSYQRTPVPREMIEAIIDAGNLAPSGCNRQPWRFVVVENETSQRRLVDAALPTYRDIWSGFLDSTDEWFRHQIIGLGSRCQGWPPLSFDETVDRLAEMESSIYWDAPVIIFVIGPPSGGTPMVLQNVMLAAHSLGLGSCVVGFGAQVTGDPELVQALGLQEGEQIYAPVVVGYPAIVPEPPAKRPPVVKWI